jgi:hypothetical protein
MQMPASNYVKVVHAVISKARMYHTGIFIILGSAVMWKIFSSHSDMVPTVIRARVIQAYDALPNKLPDRENPIEQRKLTISGEGNNFWLVSSSDKTNT